jgi:biotin carboxyl carrier protein
MDIKRIEALIEIIEDARVMELSVRQGNTAVIVRKSAIARSRAAAPKTAPEKAPATMATHKVEAAQPAGPVIPAPMVGIFHSVEGIGGPGTPVKKGQVVGVIESMKLMNEVISPADGVIGDIRVEDGTPVGYGQILFRLEGEA